MLSDEDKAFLELVERQRDLIWHVCNDYSLSAAWTAEDAFQEVFSVLWRDWPTFEGRSTESHWVWRLATHRMLELKRKMSNQPQGEVPAHYDAAADDEGDIEYLRQLIDTLGDKDATIVRAHLDGYSNKEIGSMVKLPATAVAMRLSRARNKLRQRYEKRF